MFEAQLGSVPGHYAWFVKRHLIWLCSATFCVNNPGYNRKLDKRARVLLSGQNILTDLAVGCLILLASF